MIRLLLIWLIASPLIGISVGFVFRQGMEGE